MDITFGIANVAVISVICYLVGMLIRATGLENKWIPSICGVTGAVLGVVAYALQMPDFPAGDPLTAVAVGIVSGLAATGIDQAVKQLQK